MNSPKVSIILPAHNGEKYIKYSIESVLNQTYKNFEFIIINDYSDDSTLDIINSYVDNRIKVYSSDINRHIAYSLNFGISKSKGEYIARIDCDDIWEIDKLQKQIDFLENNVDIGAIFTKVNIIDENNEIANKKYSKYFELFNKNNFETQKEWLHYFFFNGNCLCHPSVVIRKSVLENVGYYNLSCVPGEDYELWIRIVCKYKIKLLEEKLVKYRWTQDTEKVSSTDTNKRFPFYNIQLIVKYYLFDFLNDDEFIYYFSDYFVNPNSKSVLELECEKAFLLLNCVNDGSNIRFLGWLKLYNILMEKEGLKTLESKYNFNLVDLYKQYDETNFKNIFVINEINDLNMNLNQLKDLSNNQKEYIDTLNSVVTEKEQYIHKLDNIIVENKEYIDKLNSIILDRDEFIKKLNIIINDQNEYINKIQNSFIWKISKPFRKIANLFKK